MAKPNMVIDGGGDPFAEATTSPSMTTWIVNLLKNVPELKAIYDTVRDPVTGKISIQCCCYCRFDYQ
jgi:hypothetical protein